MAKNTKTPVMILQELSVKRNTVPEYELIYSQQGTHENTFHYQVTVFSVRAVGIGRSKKEAKHEAAIKILELLAKEGIIQPDLNTNEAYPVNRDVLPEHAQTKAPLNCIPKLLDICVENKIPLPEFVEISAVGPPHCREFTYECHVASITTRAIAGSKKHSKQLAAKEMLNRIINVIPDIQEQMETDQLKLTETDEQIIEKFTTLSKFSTNKLNFNSKVIEYDLQFKVLMKDMYISREEIMMFLDMPPSEDVLEQLLRLVELQFDLNVIQETPPVVVININSDTPVTIIESGSTLADASQLALEKTFSTLRLLLI